MEALNSGVFLKLFRYYEVTLARFEEIKARFLGCECRGFGHLKRGSRPAETILARFLRFV